MSPCIISTNQISYVWWSNWCHRPFDHKSRCILCVCQYIASISVEIYILNHVVIRWWALEATRLPPKNLTTYWDEQMVHLHCLHFNHIWIGNICWCWNGKLIQGGRWMEYQRKSTQRHYSLHNEQVAAMVIHSILLLLFDRFS